MRVAVGRTATGLARLIAPPDRPRTGIGRLALAIFVAWQLAAPAVVARPRVADAAWGDVREIPGVSFNSGVAGIAAGPDGNVWFTEALGNRIGRITSAGVVTEFSTGIFPNGYPAAIAAGPDGNLWFTETSGDRI